MNDSLMPPEHLNSAPNPIPAPAFAPHPEYQTAPVSNKSYVVTWLLSLLLGTFGVDRYYLGRYGTGFLKFITLGGLGFWTLIDWISITLGLTRDRQGRTLNGYPQYKKIIQGISVVLFIISLGLGIYHAVHDNPNVNTVYSQKKSVAGDLVEEKLDLVRLSFTYPKTWKVTEQGAGTQDGHKSQVFFLESPDGFKLGFQVNDRSYFTNSAADTSNTRTVEEVVSTTPVGSGVVLSDSSTTKSYASITVARGSLKVGDTVSTANKDLPTNPAINDLYISINGGLVNGFSTLAEFNNQPSVKQAVLILQSLKYY